MHIAQNLMMQHTSETTKTLAASKRVTAQSTLLSPPKVSEHTSFPPLTVGNSYENVRKRRGNNEDKYKVVSLDGHPDKRFKLINPALIQKMKLAQEDINFTSLKQKAIQKLQTETAISSSSGGLTDLIPKIENSLCEQVRTTDVNDIAPKNFPSNEDNRVSCGTCGKVYKHRNCLIKHEWEHTEVWNETRHLCHTKNQHVQFLEAAQALCLLSSFAGIKFFVAAERSPQSEALSKCLGPIGSAQLLSPTKKKPINSEN